MNQLQYHHAPFAPETLEKNHTLHLYVAGPKIKLPPKYLAYGLRTCCFGRITSLQTVLEELEEDDMEPAD